MHFWLLTNFALLRIVGGSHLLRGQAKRDQPCQVLVGCMVWKHVRPLSPVPLVGSGIAITWATIGINPSTMVLRSLEPVQSCCTHRPPASMLLLLPLN